jgi:hypothetical protein
MGGGGRSPKRYQAHWPSKQDHRKPMQSANRSSPFPMKFGEVKYTREELRAGHRMMGRHLGITLRAIRIPLISGVVILIAGNYLVELVNVDPDSILFQLWPFNHVYLRQFAGSPYSSADVRWFFTVVSCTNVVWLLFLCWKLPLDLFRRDVAFPSKSANLGRAIGGMLFAFCIALVVSIFENVDGFSTYHHTIYSLSLGEPIATGAFKVVTMFMFFLYFSIACVLEFGGLAIRYQVAKRTGSFPAGNR